MAAQPFSTFQFSWADSDMATHWEWAGRIVHGDLLTRDAYQPYPPWMQGIAPLETWLHWHGPATFNKAPLYPYLLAGMRATVGENYLPIGICHLVIGVLNVALVFWLAARYFDLTTATVAGLGAALYGPSLLYETLLLRDPLGVTVSLLLLLALARCTTAQPGPWMLAGVVFAVALLGRELVAPFGVLVALWIWQRFRSDPRDVARALGAFIVGAAVGLMPLVARNLAVGAPPLALSAIGVEGIVYGHAVDAAPAQFDVPAATSTILQAADGKLLATIRGTLATYDGDWMRLVRNEAARTAAIFSGLEGSDNVNWYYFLDRSPLLAYMLPYALVVGFGLVGIWLARSRVRGDDRIVLYYLAVSLASLQFIPVIGRYRLVVVSLLVIYAAVAVVTIARALRARAWRTAAGPAIASACLAFVSARMLLVPGLGEWCRPNEYVRDLQLALQRHDDQGVYDALRSCADCAAKHPDGPVLPEMYRDVAHDVDTMGRQIGRRAESIAVIERLWAAYPHDPSLPPLVLAARQPPLASGQ
jgi:4-amino-4-deoxy-L-arabinose transferase-like glycosyltransferase